MERRLFPVEIQGGPKVHMLELLPSELINAMKLAGVNDSSAAMGFDITQQGLRNSLRKINGVDVTWKDIKTDKQLQAHIPRTRHITKLATVWDGLHMATAAELQAITDSAVISDDGVAERWLVTLPWGTEGERVALIAAGEPVPKGRTVLLVEQPPASIGEALAIGELSSKSPAAQTFSMLMANGRRSITEIDGEKVAADQLEGNAWDDVFSVKETFILGEAWAGLHVGGGEAILGEALPTSGA